MIKLGLTGSIGMGKSTTADIFRSKNIPVHDADFVVHQLYQKEAVEPVAAIFPDAVTKGIVDRKILGSIVLGNSKLLKKLEAIIHPLVHQKEQSFLRDNQEIGAPLVVLDIPLLFETGGENRVDVILVVTANEQIQRERVLAREDMSIEKFKAILAKQLPDEEKKKRADYVLDTGLGMEHAYKFVEKIVSKYA